MPLLPGKSKEAFSHNVAAEVNAGKPQDQAVAIAYSEKRKHMAEGGEVSDEDTDSELHQMAADELMKAIETKDKKQFLDAMRAMILSVKG